MEHHNIDILDRINTSYHRLPAAERKIADYVLARNAQVQLMSITQLADECGIAEATVSRFCRNLDLKGFNAFKLELARHSAGNTAPQRLPTDSTVGRKAEIRRLAEEAVGQTLALLSGEEVHRAVGLIEKGPRIICMGSGGSMLMASECAHLFSTVSSKFYAVSDSHTQMATAATMGAGEVVILFSYSGATTSGLQVLELAKSRGIPTILVTRFKKSPAAKLADVVLHCGSNEGPFQPGSVPAKIAQLIVMDVLFQEYCSRNEETCRDTVQRIASAISGKHI